MAQIKEEENQARETELILAKMSKKKHSKLTANDYIVEKDLSLSSYESKASRTNNVKREMKIHHRGIDEFHSFDDLFGQRKALKKQENIE